MKIFFFWNTDIFTEQNHIYHICILFNFFSLNKLLADEKRVWLLLFDLNLRHFTKRDPVETKRKNILFKDAELLSMFFLYIFFCIHICVYPLCLYKI